MDKKGLVTTFAEKLDITKKDAAVYVDTVLDIITETLASGEEVKLYKFGTFLVRDRAARKGHNPNSGEVIDIPATKSPAFKPAKAFKDAVK